MRAIRTVLGVVAFGLLAGGCQNKLHDENQQLWSQNRELQAQLNETRAQLQNAPDPSQLAGMQSAIAERDARIAELQSQLQRPVPQAPADPLLAGIEVTRDDRAGTVTVNVPGDVLFAPGSADLKESAKATLNRIAQAIKRDYTGKKVFVDGHSDSDPISRTKDKWRDNLDLSAARARAVAQYLISQGVPQGTLGTRAFGPTSPKQSKDRSRRVEIVVSTN
jgi:flagellar motor protein MotB